MRQAGQKHSQGLPLDWYYLQSEEGFALITVLLLVFMALMITTVMTVSGLQTRMARNLQHGHQAMYLAEAGLHHAMRELRSRTWWRDGIAQTGLGQGTYQVTVAEPVPGEDVILTATGEASGAQRTLTLTLRNEIITVAGNGTSGSSGDSGPATIAQLNKPSGVIVDGQGNLLIADYSNNRVRRVAAGADGSVTGAADEIISTVTGTGASGYLGDTGPATAAQLSQPTGLFLDSQGTLFIVEEGNSTVRRVDAGADGLITGAADEIITTVVGTGTSGYSGDNGPATAAQLDSPTGLYIGAQSMYIADLQNGLVRRVDAGGDGVITGAADEIITTVAGKTGGGPLGDGSPATNAILSWPTHVYVDALGHLFIADQNHSRIRRVDAGFDGVVTGLSDEIISTVAGTGQNGYTGDGGSATNAKTGWPTGVFIDPQGNLVLTGTNAGVVRLVVPGADGVVMGDPDEIISTIAGKGVSSYSGDGGPPTDAALNMPYSVFVDASGNLFIADLNNHRIRRTVLRQMRWEG